MGLKRVPREGRDMSYRLWEIKERGTHFLSFTFWSKFRLEFLRRLRPLSPHRRLLIRFCFLLFQFFCVFFRIQWLKNKSYYLLSIHFVPSPSNSHKTSSFIHIWGKLGFRRLPSQVMAELGFKARLETFECNILTAFLGFFMLRSTNCHQNDRSSGGGWCLLKRQIPRAHPAVENDSLRMWSGNLHFNKFSRCFPCIWESLNFIPVLSICEREGGGARRREGKMGQERERRQTTANAVYCMLVHVLGMLFWPFDEMQQRKMVMIFKLQII